MNPEPRYLTLKQIAETLQVDKRTVRRYVQSGRLKVIRLSANATRVDREDFVKFIKAARP